MTEREEKMIKELQQINYNIGVYKGLINSPGIKEEAKESLRSEVSWLENQIIPQLTCYDV